DVRREKVDRYLEALERSLPDCRAAQRLALDEARKPFGKLCRMCPLEKTFGVPSDAGTRQRFGADDRAGTDVDQRLVEQIDLLVRNHRLEHHVANGGDGHRCPVGRAPPPNVDAVPLQHGRGANAPPNGTEPAAVGAPRIGTVTSSADSPILRVFGNGARSDG